MKRITALILTVCILAVSLTGCDLKKIGENLSDVVNEISNFGGESVEFIIEESTKVEPAAVPTDSEKSHFCYRVLNSEQKRIYRIILTAVKEMTDGFIELGSCNESYNADIAIAYQAVANDHPELFWMPYSYLINNAGSQRKPKVLIAMSYEGNEHSCDWLVAKGNKDYMESELLRVVDEITAAATGMSRYEAELYFHDILCKNVDYIIGEPEDLVYTSYGALINGEAVCEGYSRAMQLLCQQLGIPCTLISGESDGTGHLWNLIDPGDGWYHLDVTWDDNDETGEPYRFYFNLTDDEIKRDRTISPDISEFNGDGRLDGNYNLRTDTCKQTNYNYYNYEGLNFGEDYETTVAARIYEATLENKDHLGFRFTDDELFQKFEDDYQSYVTDIQRMLNRSSADVSITDISIIKNTVIFYW